MVRSESEDGSSSGYDSDSSVANSSSAEEEDDAEEEEEEGNAVAAAAAKKQRVRADIDEMHRMMANMDVVKARLQQRFAAEQQAGLERLAREDKEREVQDAARCRVEQEARGRQVAAGVQTEAGVSLQQMKLSQQSSRASHLADGAGAPAAAALPAVDGGAGFADAAPNKGKPAGLSLYDLVKASGFGVSRKKRSPVHEVDPVTVLPTRSSNEHQQVSLEQQQEQQQLKSLDERSGSVAKRDWGVNNPQLSQDHDSVVGGSGGCGSRNGDEGSDGDAADLSTNSNRGHSMQSKGQRTRPLHYDENSSSVSNSLVSSDTGNRPAVFPDLVAQRAHKFNAAALLSFERRAPSSDTNASDHKTDEQREMEAIQCLLFGHRSRR